VDAFLGDIDSVLPMAVEAKRLSSWRLNCRATLAQPAGPARLHDAPS